MSTSESIDKVTGKMVTTIDGFSPASFARVTSVTEDGALGSAMEVAMKYGDNTRTLKLMDVREADRLVDALLEHVAARAGRLDPAITIGEIEARRNKLREDRKLQQATGNSPGES
jgi:hypothetical protein